MRFRDRTRGRNRVVCAEHVRADAGAEPVGGGRLDRENCQVGGIATAEASTAPLRDPAGVFPDVALRRLPASGIVIFASGYQEGSPPPLPAGPPLPYRLSEYRRDAGWEGQPAVNVPQYVLAASRGNHLLDVRVFFGTQAPNDRELARAQAELGTLSWG